LNEDAGLTGKLQHLCMPGKNIFGLLFIQQSKHFNFLPSVILDAFIVLKPGLVVGWTIERTSLT